MKKLLHNLLIGALACLPFTTQAQVQLLDSIVAVVDNDVVMASELEERVTAIYQRIQQSGTEAPPRDVLVNQILERLILERIQLNIAQRAGIRISDEEINQAMAKLAQTQNMTLDQFIQQIHDDGLSLAEVRNQLQDEMSIARLQQGQVNRRIIISNQEVDNFLKSEEGKIWSSPDVNLGHILLPLSSSASREAVAEARSKAEALLEQLGNGADFRQLAIAHSSGQNALEGGALGWRKTAQLPEIFIAAIETLEPGQVSAPIRSDAGFHILKLYERRGGGEQLIQQSKVRHILLKPNEIRDDEATRQQLEKLRQQIIDGANFAELAQEHSEDIGSALSGGELGWSMPGQFVPQFEAVMNSIAVDEISEPFRSQFGWHILQVTERRQQDFSEDIKRRQAENILRNRKFDQELEIWLQEIRDEAFVEIKS